MFAYRGYVNQIFSIFDLKTKMVKEKSEGQPSLSQISIHPSDYLVQMHSYFKLHTQSR